MTDDVSWPVAILDFEASGLARFSFPIEVGFARWAGIDEPIESWSTLIRPDYDWTYWSLEAEMLHGICQEDLKFGKTPRQVCLRLNEELKGCLVCCDGLLHDQVWWKQLYEAAAIRPIFELESMIKLYHWGNPRLARWLEANDEVPHHARLDALRLMRAFAFGLKRRPTRLVLP